MVTTELAKTSRRESREVYSRFLLGKAGLEEIDIEDYLTTKMAALENKSLLDLIYSGDYARAVDVVERFIDDLQLEEL